MQNIQDKFRGCLIGLATGDVLGAPYEFKRPEEIQAEIKNKELHVIPFEFENLKFPAGFYTDDTSLMICLAESLAQFDFNLSDQFNRYKRWLDEGYNSADGQTSYGVGRQTYKSLTGPFPIISDLDGHEESAGGNGSLMRTAPIGLKYFGNYSEIQTYGLLAGYLTHNNLIAGWCCVVQSAVISMIIDGKDKYQILPAITRIYKDLPREITKLLTADFKKLDTESMQKINSGSGYSLDTLFVGLWAWQTSKDFEESITKAVLVGGDTDTNAAVAGALSGAEYGLAGIPNDWWTKIMNKDKIIGLADQLTKEFNQ